MGDDQKTSSENIMGAWRLFEFGISLQAIQHLTPPPPYPRSLYSDAFSQHARRLLKALYVPQIEQKELVLVH